MTPPPVRLLAWLAVSLAAAVGCGPSREADGPRHAILVSIDTLRRDHLTPYGYGRDTTPHLQRLAEAGIVFEQAIAANTNTAPSHASMFTGLHPHRHGVLRNGYSLDDEVATLAEQLPPDTARGAFVSGYPLQRTMSQLDRGFEHYDDAFDEEDGADWQRRAEDTVVRATAWLESVAKTRRPIFLFVHLYDPHHPYDAPEPFATRFLPAGQVTFRFEGEAGYERFWEGEASREELREYVARYDGEIAYTDHHVGQLFAALERLGLWDESLVLVLSDHGETLDERAAPFAHGGRAYDEQVRVPLLLRLPGDRLAGTRVAAPVHHIDVAPTLLDFLGVATASEVDGISLRPLVENAPAVSAERPLFTTALPQAWRVPEVGAELDPEVLVAAVRTGRWKLIAYPGRDGPIHHLFDLAADPDETRDVASEVPETKEALARRLAAWQPDAPAPVPELDAEQEAALKALGYLDSMH